MKARPDQLKSLLQKKLQPAYLISGDEPLQVLECADQVRQQARNQGYSERRVYHVDNSFDWSALLETANTLSLFSHRQIIELRMPSGKPGDSGRKALLDYLKDPAPDNLLLIITARLEGAAQQAKWFKALDKVGVFVPVWPIEPGKLPGWIGERLRQAGFKATPGALTLLAEQVEGNLLAAAQEIEKLKLLIPGSTLDEEAIREAVSSSARYDVFQLADAALDGQIKNTVRIFDALKAEGVEPPVVLWLLAREIRLLSFFCRQLSRGVSHDTALTEAARVIGFSPYLLKRRLPLINKAAARHSEKEIRALLVWAGDIDRQIKGVDPGNPWSSLLGLTLALAGLGIARHH